MQRRNDEMIPQDGVFVIAEAGVNHNGSLDLAKRLVEEACRAGADCVKFQSFKAERLASRTAPTAPYQHAHSSGTQYEMLKRLELSEEDHWSLLAFCRKNGIIFLSSPFDEESADLLEHLGVAAFKVPSGELTNHGFLRYLARKGKPMIVSTGMATLAEVAEAVDVIVETGGPQLVLLHCVTEYPAAPSDVNLRAMLTLADAFGLPVGYSDHTPGIEVAAAAVALGARIIEKHFTLSRDMEGPDHRASLEPRELSSLVAAIRNVQESLGDGIKRPTAGEMSNIVAARKSVVAVSDITRGERLSWENVAIRRPGDGIQPKDVDKVMGLRVSRDVKSDRVVTWDDLK